MNLSLKQENLIKTFLKYVSLNILGMIGLSCYILADTYFIAKGFGAEGLTALNLALPIYSLINGIGLMIGMGGATRYSILRGQRKINEMNVVFSRSIRMVALSSLLIVGTGVLFADKLTILLGAAGTIRSMTETYLTTILVFTPMFFLNNVLICFIRNDGNPRLSMAAMLTGSFSNIILDYFFIFKFNMGMFGAAFATGLAPIISMLILSAHFIQRKNQFKFIHIKRNLYQVKDIASLGMTSFIMEASSGIVMLAFNLIILKLEGNLGVAAYGIIANLALVGIAIFTGLAQGLQPIVSLNYGKGERGNTHRLYRYGIITAILIAATIYSVTFFLSETIVALFNEDRNAYLTELAGTGMKYYFTAFLFVGINIVTAAYFSAMDKPVMSFVISILRGVVIIIPAAFLLSIWFGMTGIWLTLTFTEIITLVIAIILSKCKKTY